MERGHPGRSNLTSYEKLAAAHLLPAGRSASRVELEFASATAFRSGGHTLPFPLPALVYGGLLSKWNDFAPVAVSEEVRRFAGEMLVVSAQNPYGVLHFTRNSMGGVLGFSKKAVS